MAEALIALFLTLVILLVSGGLIRDYSQSLRNTASQDQVLEAGLVAVSRMGQEATESLEFVRPAPGSLAPDSELVFTRIDPRQEAARLPDPVPTPATWDPIDPAYTVEVRYYLNGDRLVREVTGGGDPVAQEIGDGVTGLALTNQPDGTLLVEVSVFNGRVTRRIVNRVYIANRSVP